MFVRATSTESNKSKMLLIHSSKKNTKKLFDAKTRNENEKQNQTKSEKIDKTERKDSHNNQTNRKIYVQTLQKQIR